MSCKISIITITYNSEKTLEDTIKSIISQKYDNLEYIIIDGGSKDKTLEIVERYKEYISYFKSEPDKGICDAFNKGILAATGDVIGIINSDDMLCQNALQFVAKSYSEDIDVYYGKGKRLYDDGHMDDYLPKKLSYLKYGMALVHPSTFVTRIAYEKYGMFDLKYRACMDRELFLRIKSNGGRFKYIDEYLSVYRMGGFSDENYTKIAVKERDELSIKYGANRFLIYLNSIKITCAMNYNRIKKRCRMELDRSKR